MNCLRWIFCSVVFVCALTVSAQQPIDLKRADMLRTESGPDGVIRYLDGDVWITQDTLSVTCEHARYEEDSGKLFCTDSVHFVEPNRQIWADEVLYYEYNGRADAMGNVRIIQDSIVIYCDKVVYSEARTEANFSGNVRIFSLPDKTTITGNHGIYNHSREYGIITDNPELIRWFDDEDSLKIEGEIIEYFFSQKRAIVRDSVQIHRGDFHAFGDELYYWEEDEHAKLFGSPVINHKQDILTADTVNTFFVENQLNRVILDGKAMATSPVDSVLQEQVNTMSGQTIEMTFRDNEVDSVYVRGNATSVYFLSEEDDQEGANIVSGNAIDIWMDQGEIAWIYIVGGAEGTYFPEHLKDKVSEKN